MFVDILIIIGSLILIISGANFLTKGSVIIARRFNIPELIIGLTVIAIGTSTPEIVVSFASALKGNGEMAVGNVIGSNIFNTLMIIGVSALINPMRLSKENTFRNLPLLIATSLVFVMMTSSILGVSFMPKTINRVEGIILLICFFCIMYYTIRLSRSGSNKKKTELHEELEEAIKKEKEKNRFFSRNTLAIPMILGGLAALIYGGDLFLASAIRVAKALGVSEFVISVTLMAGGTSLPELASCVIAAKQGKSQLALGNVIGSNISNILLVLGGAAVLQPLSLSGITMIDVLVVVLSSVLLIITPFTFKKGRIDRIEGAILIAIYLIYTIWLLFK